MTKTAAVAKWGEDERGNWDAKAQKQDVTRDVKQSLLDAGLVLCTTIRNLVIGAITTEELTLIKSQAGELEQALHDAGAQPADLPPPVVADMQPTMGAQNTILTITGSGFAPDPRAQPSGNKVTVGAVDATIVSWADTVVVVTAKRQNQPFESPFAVYLTRADGAQAACGSFTFVATVTDDGGAPDITLPNPAPTVTSLEPVSGPDGTEILITGTGFQPQGEHSQVLIGTENATVLSWAEDAVVIAAVRGPNVLDAPLAVWLRPNDKQDVNAGAFTYTEETEARSSSKKRK